MPQSQLDTNALLSGAFWLKGMITFKANNSDVCLNILFHDSLGF